MDIKLRHPFNGDFPVTQAFGRYSQDVINQFHLTSAYSQLHWGIDFALPIGTPVVVADHGVVKSFGLDAAKGNYVIVDHQNGAVTEYYHLNEHKVNIGEALTRGQEIGISGNTGMSTGPHLHFQLSVNNERVDPMPFFGEYAYKEAPVVIAPQFVSEIMNPPQTVMAPQVKDVGNTSNVNWDDLSKIALNLGLPLNTVSYDQIILWNPELKTGNYDRIPAGVVIKVPETYNMPVHEAVQAPVVPQTPQPTEVDFTVNPGETLGDILLRKYNIQPDWAGYHNGTGNVFQLLNDIKKLNPDFTGLKENTIIKLPINL